MTKHKGASVILRAGDILPASAGDVCSKSRSVAVGFVSIRSTEFNLCGQGNRPRQIRLATRQIQSLPEDAVAFPKPK
jgi:hypothetical protein